MNISNEDETRFNITQAAKLVGVVSATLRNWEKEGLFTAQRLENGYRTYSLGDIETLRYIHRLLDQGMSINAVRSFIHPVNLTPSASAPVVSRSNIAQRWRKNRLEMGHSIDHVASQTDISPSYLHKIETAQAKNISFDILQRLASFYGEDILAFQNQEAAERSPQVKDRKGDPLNSELSGVQLRSLTRCPNNLMTIMIYDVQPNCGRLTEIIHNGEEFIYILSGEIIFTLDNIDYNLKKGDSLHFKSGSSHKWMNSGQQEANLLWVYTDSMAGYSMAGSFTRDGFD